MVKKNKKIKKVPSKNNNPDFQNVQESYQDEEVSLKDIIVKVREFSLEVWTKKWGALILILPLALYFGYNGYKDKIIYEAKLTYTLSDGGAPGGLSGLLGTFGLGNTGKINLDRIVQVSKSRINANKIFFSKLPLDTFDQRVDYVANHLIALTEIDQMWAKSNLEFANFRFKTSNIDSFSKVELQALKGLYELFINGSGNIPPVFTNSFNKDSGILTLQSKSYDEQLSIYIVNRAYETIKQYYNDAKTESPASSLNFVEAKKDSITGLLRSKQFQLAKFNDSHRNLIDPSVLVEKKMIETEIQKLTLMYGEVTKNYELADFSLETSKPEIDIIDAPISPLDGKVKSWLIETIKGGILGALIAMTLMIIRKIFIDAMLDNG